MWKVNLYEVRELPNDLNYDHDMGEFEFENSEDAEAFARTMLDKCVSCDKLKVVITVEFTRPALKVEGSEN